MMLSSDKRYADIVVNRMPFCKGKVTKVEFIEGGSMLE